MSSIYNYVEKYGNVSFLDKEFNVVDSMIFSALTYIDFSLLVGKSKINLVYALEKYLEDKYFYKYIKSVFLEKDIIKLCKLLVNSKRYSDVEISNYIYKLSDIEQFGALTFIMPGRTKFISYLGTDDTLVAWFEDFNMVHQFPVPAQRDAIKYLNKNVSLFDKKVYVGGHSKGGNLALVATMYCNPILRMKVKRIISLDGPGLRYKEINSKRFHKLENMYEHIVPNYSIVGLLLRNNGKHKVVKSTTLTPESHSMFTWVLDDDKLSLTTLCSISKKLDQSIVMWLDEHSDITRREMVYRIFNAIKDAGIVNVQDFMSFKNLYNLLKNIHGLDQGTKRLLMDFFKFNLGYIIKTEKKD